MEEHKGCGGHDHDHDHDHGHHHHEENINIRAAVVHVIGDMLQSIGVIIASILIYFYPEAQIADPICTYLFSILVIITTIPVFKACLQVLMEQVPTGINAKSLKEKVEKIDYVETVDDFHVWALAGGKNFMTCHIKLVEGQQCQTKEVYSKVQKILES